MWFRFLAFPLALVAGLAVAAVLAVALVIALAYPNLPSLQALTEYQPKIPLRIYSAEGVLFGEFGEERRSVVSIEEVPDALKHAILAAEDERFYEHPGIDYVGVLRAAYANLVAGGRRQGASTITMQVARNFFLSSEKTATRKLYEVLLAFKIEHSLTKDQILELYVNQIYLGQRAYGFAAAAQIYFGKSLEQLSLAETAMLAGLPKAPSMYNPVANLQRSRQRQHYVLRRMSELGHITAAQYEDAVNTPPKWCARRWPSVTPTRCTRAASASTPPCAKRTRRQPTWPCVEGSSSTTVAAAIAARKAMPSCPPPLATTISRKRSLIILTMTNCSPRWCWPRTRSRSRRRCAAAKRSRSAARACALRRAPSIRRRPRSAASAAAPSSACKPKPAASPGKSCSCRRSSRLSSRSTHRTARCARWWAASISAATNSIT